MLVSSPWRRSIILIGCVWALVTSAAIAQSTGLTPLDRKERFALDNRAIELQPDGVVHLDAREGEGLAWISGAPFTEGRLSIEVKGVDEMGRSFVGLAFHGSKSRSHFEVVYLRPFNFRAPTPERRSHALQYMSMPNHPWSVLREQFPGKYEAAVAPAPAPDAWVRLTLEVNADLLRVYINDDSTPSLTATLLGTQGGDAVALWVGNNSEGWFRNLRIGSLVRSPPLRSGGG